MRAKRLSTPWYTSRRAPDCRREVRHPCQETAMPRIFRARFAFAAFLFVLIAMFAVSGERAQTQSPDISPVNDLPNPYRTIRNWAKLPEGRIMGSSASIHVDRDG